ncbi:unnamed protein product [Amoebophrya sp. A25]|nr:unnamed protein product [Amoebophrya sp. A25]|eukprot:GSA25T00023985001.1
MLKFWTGHVKVLPYLCNRLKLKPSYVFQCTAFFYELRAWRVFVLLRGLFFFVLVLVDRLKAMSRHPILLVFNDFCFEQETLQYCEKMT